MAGLDEIHGVKIKHITVADPSMMGAAVSEAELTELRLRAPAGLTTDELRYMLSQSVADCAAALPDISAAMVWDACPKRLGGAAARVP